MLKNKTVLVLGAGASREAGMPLGIELAEKIGKSIYFKFDVFGSLSEGDRRMEEIFRQTFGDRTTLGLHFTACRKIHDGITTWRSIDNYVDAHKSNAAVQTVAKLTITENILRSERSTSLYISDGQFGQRKFDDHIPKDSWFSEFFNILFGGVSSEALGTAFDNLSVVSFNYDRCFQQAAALWMMSAYHLTYEKCLEFIANLKITYPYGTVGKLARNLSTGHIPFGSDVSASLIMDISKNIKTYSEQVSDINFQQDIASDYGGAETIIFLGCAFHPQNLKLLVSKMPQFDKRVFGTAFGLSKDDCVRVTEQIVGGLLTLPDVQSTYEKIAPILLGDKIRLHNEYKCCELIKHYKLTLSAY